MTKVSRSQYLSNMESLSANKLSYIKSSVKSDEYWTHEGLAYVGVSIGKNDIATFNGLFSLLKGNGATLLSGLLKRYPVSKLNCTGEKLREYYESFGFVVYLSVLSIDIEDETFYEMVHV